MKRNFKKIFSLLLVALMLAGMVFTAIPASAASTITLAPNEDNYINGVKVRFETYNQTSYAKIENGKLIVHMSEGDLLWFPGLTVKDATSAYTFENLSTSANNAILEVVNHVSADTAKQMYMSGYANSNQWVCALWKWSSGSSKKVETYNTGCGAWYTTAPDGYGMSKPNNGTTDGNWTTSEALSIRNTFVLWASYPSPRTYFYEGTSSLSGVTSTDSDVNFKYYPFLDTCAGTSFGLSTRSNNITYTIDKITATNMNEKSSYTEDFDSVTYDGPVVNLRAAGTNIEFDDSYAFIEFKFEVDSSVSADTKFVVKKNGTVYEEKTVGSFIPDGDGVCTYTTEFTEIAYSDALTICLEKGGSTLIRSTYDIDYGAQYQDFVENPPPANSDDLVYEKYGEDFGTLTLTLKPGENIVNGQKWYYIKNSTNGSAKIENGSLYFTGSNCDMILFTDLNLDHTAYRFSYNVTYTNTPANDNWDDWDSWFGGLHYLSAADGSGKRNGFVTAVTPNDVYMLQGDFSNGKFVQNDSVSGHVTFPNVPQTPTQGSGQFYWGSRLGKGAPAVVYSYCGVSGNGYGGLGMSAYSVTGTHQVSANTKRTDGYPLMDRRTGSFGFACGESEVSVVVDNISFMIKGKAIMVDGEKTMIAPTGELNISDLQKDGQILIYAKVDGVLKRAGDVVTATRSTEITTLQIAISTKKVAADGKTGLKWTTQISKADYQKLTTDTNIKKLSYGTVVVPTTSAKKGVTKTNSAKVDDITGTPSASGSNYVFSGVHSVEKDDRDVSYSGVGYVQATLSDNSVVVAYAPYVARSHGYALSDLVDFDDAGADEDFYDDEDEDEDEDDEDVTTKAPATTTKATTTKKSGCRGSIGLGGLMIVAVMGTAVVVTNKKRKF